MARGMWHLRVGGEKEEEEEGEEEELRHVGASSDCLPATFYLYGEAKDIQCPRGPR